MNLTTHVSVGSAIGLAVGNPVAGFFIGWASHHIIDSIPHSDPGSFGVNINNLTRLQNRGSLIWTISDVLIGTFVFILVMLKFQPKLAIFMTTLGSTLPDLIDNSPFWSGYLRTISPFKQFHQFHEIVHFTIKSKKYFWWGIVTQLTIITVSMACLFSTL